MKYEYKKNDEQVDAAMVISFDITKAKQAEVEANKLLKTIETAREAIIITSADGTMIYANPAMDELYIPEQRRLLSYKLS